MAIGAYGIVAYAIDRRWATFQRTTSEEIRRPSDAEFVFEADHVISARLEEFRLKREDSLSDTPAVMAAGTGGAREARYE
jgi:hypothetical protein